MTLNDYDSRDQLFKRFAEGLADEIRAGLSAGGRVTLAVPGGSTPGPVFDILSGVDLDWSRVTVMLTDERRVPADHDRSNERLIRERLLQGHAAGANFLRLVPEDDAHQLALQGELGALLPLDIVVLGMGGDMHTASLFPGSPDLDRALADDAAPFMLVEASGDLEPRITLTGPVLRGAKRVHVLITGDEKRAALGVAQGQSPETAPIALVLDRAHIHWAS